MALILEQNLKAGGSYGYPVITLGDSVIGSLTSIIDTSDPFIVILSKKTLINLKFSSEQKPTEYDYYKLVTPVGVFILKPGNFPIDGVNFFLDKDFQYTYYNPITVVGSNNGIFKGTYLLEITQKEIYPWENFTDTGHDFYSAVNISANGKVKDWLAESRENDYFKLSTPKLSSGSNGILSINFFSLDRYTEAYGANYDSGNEVHLILYNAGGRIINQFLNVKTGDTKIINNLEEGDYYINVMRVNNYDSYNYQLNISFLSILKDGKSVVLNSPKDDFFHDLPNSLDTVKYNENFNNFNIQILTTKSNDSGILLVQNKSQKDIDKSYVERVVFLDKTIAFDFSSSEAGYKSAMLIAASFGKEYIPQFFAKGLSFFDSGSTTKEIAKLIADNKFIEQLIGDNSDSAWIKHVYKNVVGVYPDKASETNYVTLLQNKTSTRSEILELAAGFTFLETRIDLVGLQTNGLVFDTLS